MGDKTLRGLVAFLSLFSIWVVVSNLRNVSSIERRNTYINDSLKNEIFIHSTNVTRYEIALERLREEDSICANKFEEKLTNIE